MSEAEAPTYTPEQMRAMVLAPVTKTIEVEGYPFPFTIRKLALGDQDDMMEAALIKGDDGEPELNEDGDPKVNMYRFNAMMFSRGLVLPEFSDEEVTTITADTVVFVANAVSDLSGFGEKEEARQRKRFPAGGDESEQSDDATVEGGEGVPLIAVADAAVVGDGIPGTVAVPVSA